MRLVLHSEVYSDVHAIMEYYERVAGGDVIALLSGENVSCLSSAKGGGRCRGSQTGCESVTAPLLWTV
jgi:hypothetical protein